MSLSSRYNILYRYTWAVPLLSIILVFYLFSKYVLLPQLIPEEYSDGRSMVPEWSKKSLTIDKSEWTVFHNITGAISVNDSSALSKHFRLAGTFFAYGESLKDSRKAILDDLNNGLQSIVNENDEIDGVKIVRIFRNRVILRDDTGETQLWLSFSGKEKDSSVKHDLTGDTVDGFGGRRLMEHRWMFKREGLLDYYSELRDDPERLIAVFDSLKPIYNDNHKITGYKLGVEGEEQFFKAVGLNEGDIIRSVNSMKMTSRRRAEYFIREFINDRANAFILDIDRNGNNVQLRYEIR